LPGGRYYRRGVDVLIRAFDSGEGLA
ncbi:hypothetical protein A2U01_0079362, partial [Trifolium medium]|nr:hypothetical protein [Trifolium medium]